MGMQGLGRHQLDLSRFSESCGSVCSNGACCQFAKKTLPERFSLHQWLPVVSGLMSLHQTTAMKLKSAHRWVKRA
ncbi:hypothetical protein ACRRTK_018394 [Alexandromys fortis]